MRVYDLKQCVRSFLMCSGSREVLAPLAHATEKQLRSLLRWMDDGGIALYFWSKIQDNLLDSHLPEMLASELKRRAADNLVRSNRMLLELQKVNQALAAAGEPYAILKGFSLSPDFCARPELRHQIDIDILVQPESIRAFRAAMIACRYALEYQSPGELKFGTAAHRIPSRSDYAYGLQASQQVELHTFFWDPLHKIDLNIPSSIALQTTGMYQIENVSFPVLSLEWRLLLQLLHAYRHFASLWLRIGWLYELAYFLEKHEGDEELFTSFLRLVERFSVERECGFILSLVSMTFKTPLNSQMQKLANCTPFRASTWLRHFGMEWVLSDFPGSKLPLMVLADFSPARESASYHEIRRMLPVQLDSLFTVTPSWSGPRIHVLRAKLMHIIRRSRFHLFSTAQYVAQSARWRMLLAFPERKTRT